MEPDCGIDSKSAYEIHLRRHLPMIVPPTAVMLQGDGKKCSKAIAYLMDLDMSRYGARHLIMEG